MWINPRISEAQAHTDVIGPPGLGKGVVVRGVAEISVRQVLDPTTDAQGVADALADFQVPEAIGGNCMGRVAGVGQLAADILAAQLSGEVCGRRPLQPGVGQVTGTVAQPAIGATIDGVEVGVVQLPAEIGRQIQTATKLQAADSRLVDVVVVV